MTGNRVQSPHAQRRSDWLNQPPPVGIRRRKGRSRPPGERHFRRGSENRRSGIALLLALIALLISTSICISLTRTILLHQQRVEQRIWRHQAELLAHAALGRAAWRLREDPDDAGTDWEVALPGPDSLNGEASIRIEQGDRAGTRIITITAEVPRGRSDRDRSDRVRSTLRTEMDVPENN